MADKKKILLCSVLLTLLLIEGGLAAKTKAPPKEPSTPVPQESVESKKSDLEQKKPFIINDEISYSYNFDADDRNFEPDFLVEKGKTKRDYTVLINIHNGSALNTSSKYKPGTRTLSWGTPYEAALRQAMSALKHPHEHSALLTSWTGKRLRTFVSFVIIPKGTDMEFKIGYASPQRSTNQGVVKEYRPGGGMQLRLKYLPKGTIVLTESLTKESDVGERTTFSLHRLLGQAINQFNNKNLGMKLPHSIQDADIAFTGIEEYVHASFEKIP